MRTGPLAFEAEVRKGDPEKQRLEQVQDHHVPALKAGLQRCSAGWKVKRIQGVCRPAHAGEPSWGKLALCSDQGTRAHRPSYPRFYFQISWDADQEGFRHITG